MSSAEDITCREFVDFLMSYLDGDLDEQPQTVFEAHLTLCPPCEAYLETYKAAVRMGKAVCDDAAGPPPDAPEDLIAAILAARRAES